MTDQNEFQGDNKLLSDLPNKVLAELVPHLVRINAPLEMPIYEPYEPIEHVYFMAGSLGSIVATTSSGQSCEIGVVGSEGAVGLEVLMGASFSPHRSMIQMAGSAYKIDADELRTQFRKNEVLRDHVLHFVQKLGIQVSQTTLCNRLHTVDERLPRWLLMCHDRMDGDVLLLTQEYIALMLGTSRVTVTQAAQQFQNMGYIKYVRGRITITDRDGIEDASCDCYKIVKKEYLRKLR